MTENSRSKKSSDFNLPKRTFVNLRWIALIGQLSAICFVYFFLNFEFNFELCVVIIFLGSLTNSFLQYFEKNLVLNNYNSTIYLGYDIIQLACLLYLTGGITNPFIILLIIPAVFSATFLNNSSTIILVIISLISLTMLSFNYLPLPGPIEEKNFHLPDYYLLSIPLAVLISLLFLVYFGMKFGNESKKRKEALANIEKVMANEHELMSLGGQAAAAAHSLGTPLSTITLIAKELKHELGNNKKIVSDIELLISQSNRCNEILKKLSVNPGIEDNFILSEYSFYDYLFEIIRSFEKISKKEFVLKTKEYQNPIKLDHSTEINYGLRNFIGNANKYARKKVNINLRSDKQITEIKIEDDGEGFPSDIIDKLGEPYIKSSLQKDKRPGLGLGTFIGKTLLERNFAVIDFMNYPNKGASVTIKWKNSDLRKI